MTAPSRRPTNLNTMTTQRALALLLVVMGLPLVALCSPPAASAQASPLGVFVKPKGAEVATFVPWTGEASVQAQIGRLRAAGGGEIVFAPGDYEIQSGFQLARMSDVRIAGSGPEHTRIHFAPEPAQRPTLLAEVTKGARTMKVKGAGTLREGAAYQLYKADLKGDRILEFKIAEVEGDTVTLKAPAHFMGHVKEIPAGSVVIDTINTFVLKECERVTIEGLHLDGGGRGDVHGHTTYCGVYAVGVYKPRVRPVSAGLTVRNCHIHGMQGRGVCVYAMKDILLEGNHVHDVDSQAMEIDHFAQGIVRGNTLENSGVGVALNDAYESIVEMNTFRNCNLGVGFVKHFDEAEFNVDNVVRANLFQGGRWGVHIQNGIGGNQVAGNVFAGLGQKAWIHRGDSKNKISGSRAAAR